MAVNNLLEDNSCNSCCYCVYLLEVLNGKEQFVPTCSFHRPGSLERNMKEECSLYTDRGRYVNK